MTWASSMGIWRSSSDRSPLLRYCDRTHWRSDFDGFILLQKEDLRVILLNNCADKWQLHSITFQWEHYSHNIGNGKTFSCAFQPGDDVWKEPICGVRHHHGESVTTGAASEPAPRFQRTQTRKHEQNRDGGTLMPVSPILQRGGRKNKPPEQLPSGARGGLQVGAFWAAHSPSGDPALPAPLRRERAPITSYYGWGNGMTCRGIKQRTNESKQNKWEGWNPVCRKTIVPRPSRQISASESATSQEYKAKQSFNGAKRP